MAFNRNYLDGEEPIPMGGFGQHPILTQPIPQGFLENPGNWETEPLNELDRENLTGVKVKVQRSGMGEPTRRFLITDPDGEKLFKAKEDNDCCNCCEDYNMKIEDMSGQQVIHFMRPVMCQCFCCPTTLQRMEVYSPLGELAGIVEKKWGFCQSQFVVRDEEGNVVVRIEEQRSFCGYPEFTMSQDGSSEVGKISMNSTGCSHVDNFEMIFPNDVDGKIKSVLLGALFMIIFMLFNRRRAAAVSQ